MKLEIRNISLCCLFLTLIFNLQTVGQTVIKETVPFNIGEQVSFNSEVLGEERILNVYLPNGYTKASDKVYPVIYLLDGSKDEDFIHVAGLVQFGSFSWINMIPETIVIGIENVDRKRDFTYPSNDSLDLKELPTSGGSAQFIEFIEKELQPLVSERYNVSKEKTIIGQSLGGLLASEILLKKPHLFDNYIIVSPSVWWDGESILKIPIQPLKNKKKIFVAVGTEGPLMQNGATSLYYKLWKDYNDQNEVYYDFLEEQNHGDTLHLAIYNAFEKFFSENKN